MPSPLLLLAAHATAPSTVDFVQKYPMERASARIELRCHLPVTVEAAPGEPQPASAGEASSLDAWVPPESCDLDEIAVSLQSKFSGCSSAVIRREKHLHVGPGQVNAMGACVLAGSPLDEPLGMAPGRHFNVDIIDDLRGAGFSHINFGGSFHFVRVTEGMSRRDFLDQLLIRLHTGRKTTWKVEYDDVGIRLYRVLLGGPYRGGYDEESGPYHHTSQWWVPANEPIYRQYTPEESLEIRSNTALRDEGIITREEWGSRLATLIQGTVVHDREPVLPPPDLLNPDADPNAPWSKNSEVDPTTLVNPTP